MVLLASLALALGSFRLAFAYNTTLVGILASEIVADFESERLHLSGGRRIPVAATSR